MGDKKFAGAPFGTQKARFDVAGVHPAGKAPGCYTEAPYNKIAIDNANMGPGKYDPEYGNCFAKAEMEKSSSGPGWARSLEVERAASMPHLLYKDEWLRKREQARKIAPGMYDIKDQFDFAERSGSTRGLLSTRENRFKTSNKHLHTPGPGTYGKGGIPDTAVLEKSHQSTSTKGLMEASSASRSLPSVGSHLGPGLYQHKGCFEATLNKVTSLRGPYDIFSEDRNKPMKTGHYAAGKTANLGPGQYTIRSFTDDMKSNERKYQGRLGKVDRYQNRPSERIFNVTLAQLPRDPDDPAPGHYSSKLPTKQSHIKDAPAFLSSAPRSDRMSTKFFTGNYNPVGAGRYDIQKLEEAQYKNGHESAFRSKTQEPGLIRSKFLQERLRSKDIQLSNRVFIVPPPRPLEHMTQHMARTKTHIKPARSNLHVHFANQRATTVA